MEKWIPTRPPTPAPWRVMRPWQSGALGHPLGRCAPALYERSDASQRCPPRCAAVASERGVDAGHPT